MNDMPELPRPAREAWACDTDDRGIPTREGDHMAVDRSYIARNNASRKRLETLVARCTDGELAQTMPAGWTVASVLAHVAFWDHRIEVLFERWRSMGTAPAAPSAARSTTARRSPSPAARHASARRALPPRPREALPAYGQARAGAGASHHGDDDVPRDGDEVLAGAGGTELK